MRETQKVKRKSNPKGNRVIQAKEETYNNYVKQEALTRWFSWLQPYPNTPRSWVLSLVRAHTRNNQ